LRTPGLFCGGCAFLQGVFKPGFFALIHIMKMNIFNYYRSHMFKNEQPSAFLITKYALENDCLTIADIDLLIFDSLFNAILFENIVNGFNAFQLLSI